MRERCAHFCGGPWRMYAERPRFTGGFALAGFVAAIGTPKAACSQTKEFSPSGSFSPELQPSKPIQKHHEGALRRGTADDGVQ